MPEGLGVFRLIHFAAFMFMAAPLFMLIIVNERAVFGRALDPKLDRYMENIITRNHVRCFVFQGTVLASGVGLLILRGYGVESLFLNWALGVKVLILLALVGLLAYISTVIQPRINSLLGQVEKEPARAGELAPQIWGLRRRRKKLSSLCLFLVLTALILGLRLIFPYSLVLTLVFIALAGVFAWRVYSSLLPWGWI